MFVLAQGCNSSPLYPWHSEHLQEEFTSKSSDEVRSFDEYRQLEDRLFGELRERVYAQVGTGPDYQLVRYSAGSAADPRNNQPDWNRSFELKGDAPVGGVLLLHGMSDSPYSLRALAETLAGCGYRVVGLRLPGHGTAPSGLRHITMHDMTAAVRLGMKHLASTLGEKPIHIVGYSNGAALALDFALDTLDGHASPRPASLVLISPAIRIHPTAGLARFKDKLAVLPGLGGLAWLGIQPEFDPYKYNSFATNAAGVVHRLTRAVERRIAERVRTKREEMLPPILVFKSTVDATVTTDAVVSSLLALLSPRRHELVLFDINRSAAMSTLLVSDPGPLTNQLMRDDAIPFAITLVTNESPETRAVVVRRKEPFSAEASREEHLDLAWPTGVISLSHVALPFPPDDPLYGRYPPDDANTLFLGEIALQGERGLLRLPAEFLLRMRYNPFYDVIGDRVLEWFEQSAADAGRPGG